MLVIAGGVVLGVLALNFLPELVYIFIVLLRFAFLAALFLVAIGGLCVFLN